ncbi:MAG: hypothetical protein AAGD92_00220 [Pseudomonadota bacterium]
MFWFFISVAIGLAIVGAGYWRWRKGVAAEIAEGSEIEWAHFQKHEPEFIAHLSEEEFKSLYARVNEPRFPGYALAALISFFAALPVIFIALTAILLVAQSVGATPDEVAAAERLFIEDDKLIFFKETPPEAALYYIRDLGGFYYFFGVLLSWLGIVAFFTRRYHSHRPGYLRDEIIRAKP